MSTMELSQSSMDLDEVLMIPSLKANSMEHDLSGLTVQEEDSEHSEGSSDEDGPPRFAAPITVDIFQLAQNYAMRPRHMHQLLVLVSLYGQADNRESTAQTNNTLNIIQGTLGNTMEEPFLMVDASDPQHHPQRDALLELSGIGPVYPQFFLVRRKKSPPGRIRCLDDLYHSVAFFGGYGDLHQANEQRTLRSSFLTLQPLVRTSFLEDDKEEKEYGDTASLGSSSRENDEREQPPVESDNEEEELPNNEEDELPNNDTESTLEPCDLFGDEEEAQSSSSSGDENADQKKEKVREAERKEEEDANTNNQEYPLAARERRISQADWSELQQSRSGAELYEETKKHLLEPENDSKTCDGAQQEETNEPQPSAVEDENPVEDEETNEPQQLSTEEEEQPAAVEPLPTPKEEADVLSEAAPADETTTQEEPPVPTVEEKPALEASPPKEEEETSKAAPETKSDTPAEAVVDEAKPAEAKAEKPPTRKAEEEPKKPTTTGPPLSRRNTVGATPEQPQPTRTPKQPKRNSVGNLARLKKTKPSVKLPAYSRCLLPDWIETWMFLPSNPVVRMEARISKVTKADGSTETTTVATLFLKDGEEKTQRRVELAFPPDEDEE